MPLDITLHPTAKPREKRYVDSSSTYLAEFLSGIDARQWTFASGPAHARKAFDAARSSRSSKAPSVQSARSTATRAGGDPAAEAAARHGITLRSRPPGRREEPPDWYEAVCVRDYSNGQIWAMVKAGTLADPRDIRAHGILARFGSATLTEMQRRGFIGI